jgi:hypothetical protein
MPGEEAYVTTSTPFEIWEERGEVRFLPRPAIYQLENTMGALFFTNGNILFSNYQRTPMIINESKNLLGYLILPDKVYKLEVSRDLRSGRAFDRDLVDFRVEAYNPLDDRDRWHTCLGMSMEMSEDYPSFNIPIPIEWLLFRFLYKYIHTNTINKLKGSDSEILMTSNFQEYLGKTHDNDQAEEIVRTLLVSWARTFPNKKIEFCDLFVSTNLTMPSLRSAINSLIFKDTWKNLTTIHLP